MFDTENDKNGKVEQNNGVYRSMSGNSLFLKVPAEHSSEISPHNDQIIQGTSETTQSEEQQQESTIKSSRQNKSANDSVVSDTLSERSKSSQKSVSFALSDSVSSHRSQKIENPSSFSQGT